MAPLNITITCSDRDTEFGDLTKVVPNKDTNHLFHTANKNIEKNRYANVLPFDKTIVKMKDSTEYINANYITPLLPEENVRFISTQAPTYDTFDTFYRMIWEHKVPVIVMLTKILERGVLKAHCYWPSLDKTKQFGEILATTICETKEDFITTRKIELTKGNETRYVTLLHYLEWPDHGVPNSSNVIRDLIERMENERITNSLSVDEDHIVVHCSAGIGRTGTFIAIYSALKFLKAGKPIKVKDIVENLREQRMLMVQSFAQYDFIYKVIDEHRESTSNSNLTLNHSARSQLDVSGCWNFADIVVMDLNSTL